MESKQRERVRAWKRKRKMEIEGSCLVYNYQLFSISNVADSVVSYRLVGDLVDSYRLVGDRFVSYRLVRDVCVLCMETYFIVSLIKSHILV